MTASCIAYHKDEDMTFPKFCFRQMPPNWAFKCAANLANNSGEIVAFFCGGGDKLDNSASECFDINLWNADVDCLEFDILCVCVCVFVFTLFFSIYINV